MALFLALILFSNLMIAYYIRIIMRKLGELDYHVTLLKRDTVNIRNRLFEFGRMIRDIAETVERK